MAQETFGCPYWYVGLPLNLTFAVYLHYIIGFTTTDENIRKPTSPLPLQNIPHLPSSRQTMTAEVISVEGVFKITGSNPLCSICHHLSFDTAVETLSCLVQQFLWEGSMWNTRFTALVHYVTQLTKLYKTKAKCNKNMSFVNTSEYRVHHDVKIKLKNLSRSAFVFSFFQRHCGLPQFICLRKLGSRSGRTIILTSNVLESSMITMDFWKQVTSFARYANTWHCDYILVFPVCFNTAFLERLNEKLFPCPQTTLQKNTV